MLSVAEDCARKPEAAKTARSNAVEYFINYFFAAGRPAPGEVQPGGGSYAGRVLTLSADGKSAGTFCVTLPVAAHSVPRWKVVMKPTQLSAARSWPMAVWKIRPLP